MLITLLDGIRVQADPFNPEPLKLRPIQAHALFALVTAPARRRTPDQLAAMLWPPGSEPAAPRRVARIVSDIRRALGRPKVITLHPDTGYTLQLDDNDLVDWDIFGRLTAIASDKAVDDPWVAELMYGQALGMWQHLPSNLPRTEAIDGLHGRLVDQRLKAVRGYCEVLLKLGKYTAIIDLLAPIAEHRPGRSDLVGLLARALAKAQRPEDAVLLIEEYFQAQLGLGLPSPTTQMRRLQQQIVDDDPTLAPPPIGPPEPDQAVIRSGGDVSGVNTYRMSDYLTDVSWPGYSTMTARYHTAKDRWGVELLRAMAPVATIQYETVHLVMTLVQEFARWGISQYLELGALVPTQMAIHAAARLIQPDVRTLYVNPDPALVRYVQSELNLEAQTQMIHGNLGTCLDEINTSDPQRPSLRQLDLTAPIAVINQHEFNLEPDLPPYATLCAQLGERLAKGSIIVFNVAVAEGITAPVGWALQEMYRGVDEQLAPRSREQVDELVPPGFTVLPPGIKDTSIVWEKWAGRKSPEALPGALPRVAVVAIKE